MPRLIAMLRGVNVGGNSLKMERLRELCADWGFENVSTYVQSGNVVFDARGSAAACLTLIERGLVGETRLPVPVVVRTVAELSVVVRDNPFLKEKGIDSSKLHVTFLGDTPSAASIESLRELDGGDDRLTVRGTDVYLHCPNGYGETRLSNNRIEKILGVRATTRNWNTVNKLLEMARAR